MPLLRVSTLALTLALAACDNRPESPKASAPAQPAPVADAAPPAANDDDPHYLAALELEAAGRHVEARAEVEQALAAGAGRDAHLLAAKLAILRDDLAAAADLLEPLVAKNPADPLAQYNLGLVAQRRGEYNRARSAYLAALKADPSHTASRYNLAVLTWDAGVREEARHHARKYIELAPNDPLAAELRARVELDGPPAAPPADPAAARPTDDARGTRPDPAGTTARGGDLKNPFGPAGTARPAGAASSKQPPPADAPTGRDLADPFASPPK